jgi:predicted PurR-regulated permease PerM
LAFTLTVLTFFAAFIPVVGAVVVGSLAVLVALVSNGLTTALIVLAIVLAVQQIESNVLQPILQSKSMELHPGIVLISVTAGGVLFGIIGAFLAVPVAASVVVVLRYLSEQVDLRTGDVAVGDLPLATPEGAVAADAAAADSPAADSPAADTASAEPGDAKGAPPA